MSGEPDRQALQEVAQTAQYTLEPVLASMSRSSARCAATTSASGPRGRG